MLLLCFLALLLSVVSSEPPVVRTKVPLCCKETLTWSPKKSHCVDWKDPAPKLTVQELGRIGFPSYQRFQVKHGFPNCSNGFYGLNPEKELHEEFTLTKEAHLIIHEYDNHQKYPHEYCLLWFQPEGADQTTFHPLVCVDESLNPMGSGFSRFIKQIFYPLALGISDVFFLLTLIVFCMLPEMRDVYGRCVMSNVSCLFCGYLLLILLNSAVRPNHGVICILVGIGMYVSFMAAFFWLNVISFHVFITARMSSLGGKNPWLWYCIYAWGSTLLCLFVFLGVEFGLEFDHPWRPAFKVQACWFVDDLPMTAFFYGPIAVILCINGILFANTAITLYHIKKDESTASRKINFRLYLKMFFIMGFTWLLELIGWRVKDDIHKKNWWIMLLLDLVNLFQGVFIFIIMVCKRKVWNLIKEKYLGAVPAVNDMEMRHSEI